MPDFPNRFEFALKRSKPILLEYTHPNLGIQKNARLVLHALADSGIFHIQLLNGEVDFLAVNDVDFQS